MGDGTEAYLTTSRLYYSRNNGNGEIAYYDHTTLLRIPLAAAKCAKCEQVIRSMRCGDFVQCKCGDSYVDTDRWMPERHRYGGAAIAI